LYDAFHFIELLTHRSSVALQACALTENASAHGGAPFAFLLLTEEDKAQRRMFEKCP
jgi:hypothetical protein